MLSVQNKNMWYGVLILYAPAQHERAELVFFLLGPATKLTSQVLVTSCAFRWVLGYRKNLPTKGCNDTQAVKSTFSAINVFPSVNLEIAHRAKRYSSTDPGL